MRFAAFALLSITGLMARAAHLTGVVPGMKPNVHYVPDVSHYWTQESIVANDITCNDQIGQRPFVPLTFTNGSCHSITRPNIGLSNLAHVRIVPATYIDGRATPRGDLPPSREVSNAVIQQPDGLPLNIKDASRLLIFFGQFIDHDFALVLEQPELRIMENPNGITVFPEQGFELIEMEIPEDDDNPRFLARREEALEAGEEPALEFGRSFFCIDDNFQRQFVSVLTPYLDLSSVYGDTNNRTALLRNFTGGLLKIDPILAQTVRRSDQGEIAEFMPRNAAGMFLCGDIRCEENTQLFSWHTLWLRNHNYWAREYLRIANQQGANLNPILDDEFLFNHARVRNIIEYQSVFWDQYMPYLLGRRTWFDLTEEYQFNGEINPITSLIFTTAIFRYGHSGVSNDLQFLDANGNQVSNTLALADAFFNAERAFSETAPAGQSGDFVGNMMMGQSSISHDTLDSRVVSGIRDNLFRDMFPPGFDLTARNLERARDHGVGFLNDYRIVSGLEPYTCDENNQLACFRQLSVNRQVTDALFELYEDFNLCEVWVCGMAEDSFEDSLLGETFTTMMAIQFNKIRNSDRLWFESEDIQARFTTLAPAGANVLAPVSMPVFLNDIISRNTDVTIDPTGNVFMLNPVWLAFAETSRFQIEWFVSPTLQAQGFVEFDVMINPGNNVLTQDADDLLFTMFSDANPDTSYTVQVIGRNAAGVETVIGETNFRTPSNGDDGGLSAGAIAGIAVAAGVVAIGAVGAVVVYSRKSSYSQFNTETFL